MKYDIKAKWLEALSSDEYEQTSGCLFDTSLDHNYDQSKKMCCLGVLTDLYIKAHPKDSWINKEIDGAKRNAPSFSSPEDYSSPTNEAYYLHPFVSEWSGVEEKGSLNLEGFSSDLSSMNDSSYRDGISDYSYVIPIISEFL